MATATRARRTTKAQPAPEPEPVEEVDELEDEVEDLEEEDAEEEAAPAPKTKAKPAAKAAPAVETKGTTWLTEHVNEQAGTSYNSAAIRILLRKLVKDGVLSREIGTDRSRYDFSGPKDPTVLAVVKAVKAGAIKEARDEKLGKLKEGAAAKKAAGTAPAPKGRAKAKPAPEPEVIDDEEFDDEEDVEEL